MCSGAAGQEHTSDRAILSSSGICEAMRAAASFFVDRSRAMRRCSCTSGEHATVTRLAAKRCSPPSNSSGTSTTWPPLALSPINYRSIPRASTQVVINESATGMRSCRLYCIADGCETCRS